MGYAFYTLRPASGEVVDPGDGLVTVGPDSAAITTGVHTGDIDLAVELWDEPPPVDLANWEEVVEVSITSTTGDLQAFEDWVETDREPFPNLAFRGPGDYRLRVHARGRAEGALSDGGDGEPVEEHLVQVWPAGAAPGIVHKGV